LVLQKDRCGALSSAGFDVIRHSGDSMESQRVAWHKWLHCGRFCGSSACQEQAWKAIEAGRIQIRPETARLLGPLG